MLRTSNMTKKKAIFFTIKISINKSKFYLQTVCVCVCVDVIVRSPCISALVF